MANYFLTERAANHLKEIYEYSLENWGEEIATRYMGQVIKRLQKLAANPEEGRNRRKRSTPYLMAPVEKHFAIYKAVDEGIIVVAVLPGMRNIEGIMERIGDALAKEIREIENSGEE